jgi:hypothetical protein
VGAETVSADSASGVSIYAMSRNSKLTYRIGLVGEDKRRRFYSSPSHNRLSQRRGIELTTRDHAVAAALATNVEAMKTRGHRSREFKRKRGPRCVRLI